MCEFDWKIFMNILSSVAVMTASISTIAIGRKGLKSWQKEKKSNLSHKVLSLFLEASDIIRRSRVSEFIKTKNGMLVRVIDPLKRAKENLEELKLGEPCFNEIIKNKHSFQALMSEDESQPFLDIIELRNELIKASSSIIKNKEKHIVNPEDEDLKKIKREYFDKKDKMNEELNRIMKSINDICNSYIKKS